MFSFLEEPSTAGPIFLITAKTYRRRLRIMKSFPLNMVGGAHPTARIIKKRGRVGIAHQYFGVDYTLVPTLCVGTDHPTLPRLFSFHGVEFPKPMDSFSPASWGRAVGKGGLHSHAERGNESLIVIPEVC